MGSAHEMVLYVHRPASAGLRDAITRPIPDADRQWFSQLGHRGVNLPGSGQAGGVEVFVLHLRKASTEAVVEHLRDLPWGHHEAVVLVTGDYIDGPMEVHRVGYQRTADYR